MTPERLSKLMRAGGALSMFSGALHVAGCAKTLIVQDGEYLRRGPYFFSIGLLLISSGLTLLWAAGGVREGARWGRSATRVAAFQAIGLSVILAPGFIYHLSVISPAPFLLAALHAFFLWQTAGLRPAGEPAPDAALQGEPRPGSHPAR